MDILRNNTLNTVVRLLCLAAVIAMIIIGLTVYRANWPELLLFIAFAVVYIQLPGQLMLKLAGFRAAHLSTLLAAGFFAGWAWVTLQYFLTELIHTNLLLYAAGPVCTAVYLVMVAKNRRRQGSFPFRFRPNRLSTAFCLFVTLGFLYAMLETQYLYLSPEIDEFISMNPDKGFHIGLINSLSHGYPLECPWFSGLYFNYHVFTELLYSVPVRLFGLTADVALLTCGPFMTVYAIGVSMYALFREMCAKARRAGLYCLTVLLSNIFIARGIDISLAFLFIFRNENTAGYGVSCTMVLVILIREWYRAFSSEGTSSWRQLLLVIAVLMLVTGIKGPFGIVMLGAVWGTFALGLILRKVPFRVVLPIILMTAGFLLVYMTVLGSKGQGTTGQSLFALATIINITFYKGPLVALMKSIGLPLIIRYAVLLAVFTVFLLTVFFVPFVIGYIRELFLVLTGKRDYDFTRITVYAASLIGFIALMVLNYHGHSQVYFGFVTVFFAPLIAFWFFEDMEDNRGVLMKLVRGFFILTLILTSIGLFSHLGSLFSSAKDASDPGADASRYKSLSHDEYEAMRWIDGNTPKDALLATDRYYSLPLDEYDYTDRWHNRFFLYSDYSNRICYLAGCGYNLPASEVDRLAERIALNDQLYDRNDPGRGDLARKLGIDYVVVSRDFTDAGDLSSEDYHLCFSNRDIDVYEIR